MIMYYSGQMVDKGTPEELIKGAHIMLTFYDSRKGTPQRRFKNLYKARKRKLKGKEQKCQK